MADAQKSALVCIYDELTTLNSGRKLSFIKNNPLVGFNWLLFFFDQLNYSVYFFGTKGNKNFFYSATKNENGKKNIELNVESFFSVSLGI